MYRIVFLLIFSVASAIGGREVKLDIYTKRDTATGLNNLMCDISPNGIQHVMEGEKINFNVQTRSYLKDFWCIAYGKTIYNPSVDSAVIKIVHGAKIQTWKTSGAYSTYEKASMDGKWTCNFRIRKPDDIIVNAPAIQISSVDYIEGNCELQFQITEPNISLSIAQIKDWAWKSQKQGIKRYDYKFMEGEKTFECILNNPTEGEENYTISFKLDGVLKNRKAKVVIKPRDKLILRHTFNLTSSSSVINCSASSVKGKGPNLRNEIYLQYLPAPHVFLNMQTIYSTQHILKIGMSFRENNTQLYDYYFTDGEQVTFKCALNDAEGDEKNYALTLCITDGKCVRSEDEETSISNRFTLKSGDQFKVITCTAFNKSPGVSLPSHLHGIINLHYRSREDTETATPISQLSITGPEKLLRWSDTIYHYNFTDGEIVDLNCSLNNATGLEKNYDIVFFNYNVSTNLSDFVMSTRVSKTSLYVYHTFTLKKQDKAIRCAAFTDHYDKKKSIDVFLQYTPQPMQDPLILSIEGSPSDLEKEDFSANNSMQLDSHEFTDHENITVTGVLNINEEDKDTYDTHRQSKVLPYCNGSPFKKDFTPKEKNRNLTSVLQKNKTPILPRVVKAKQKKKKSKIASGSGSGLQLYMDGLPPDSCKDEDMYKKNQICTYTFGDPPGLGKTLPLKCVLSGTWKAQKKTQYLIQFETYNQTDTFEHGKFKTVTAPYDVPLKEENNTVECTATKQTKEVKVQMTIKVNIYYVPPTTSTTTTEPSTTPIEPSITNGAPTSSESSDAAWQLSTGGEEETGAGAWLKWTLIAGVLLFTICIVVGCSVMCRQKKPPPAESTNALGKDLNTYQTMPVPAPRIIQKPNGTQKAGAAKKPMVTMESNYSEPKDSQDMSEALYAYPQRFNGDSDTYAEPYVDSKPSPQSDTYAEPSKPNYAEPYASISEGNYAELSLPNNSNDLYARPIPKAQRKPKIKEECNYSNVCADQYANTRK